MRSPYTIPASENFPSIRPLTHSPQADPAATPLPGHRETETPGRKSEISSDPEIRKIHQTPEVSASLQSRDTPAPTCPKLRWHILLSGGSKRVSLCGCAVGSDQSAGCPGCT